MLLARFKQSPRKIIIFIPHKNYTRWFQVVAEAKKSQTEQQQQKQKTLMCFIIFYVKMKWFVGFVVRLNWMRCSLGAKQQTINSKGDCNDDAVPNAASVAVVVSMKFNTSFVQWTELALKLWLFFLSIFFRLQSDLIESSFEWIHFPRKHVKIWNSTFVEKQNKKKTHRNAVLKIAWSRRVSKNNFQHFERQKKKQFLL